MVGKLAASPRPSRGVHVAITMLANDSAVRTVAFGELRSSIADRTVYVDCSTVSPTLSGELAAAFPVRFLALPVLGSPVAVRAGQAVYLAGGDGELVDRLGPVLASLASTVRRYDTAPMAITAKPLQEGGRLGSGPGRHRCCDQALPGGVTALVLAGNTDTR